MSKRNLHVIIGLGTTGLSCARYLAENNIPIAVIDTRLAPPQLDEFKKEFPHIPIELGGLDKPLLSQAETIVISPGISLQEPAIQQQIKRGVPVIGDIELFARAANAPIIAITGTNAKSTVTTLVGEMAAVSGIRTQTGGNLGIPALDLLKSPPQLFVLELSSFQLETTFSLKPKVASILNISPDHMDRYTNLKDYIAAKQRIYADCEIAVMNQDDEQTYLDSSDSNSAKQKYYFTLDHPKQNQFGLIQKQDGNYLAFEDKLLLPVRELSIIGSHSQANALAALAIGYAYGLPMDKMLETLKQFKGLPHRCQLVRERHHVRWYNDSKGTNVGAALAAIEGLGREKMAGNKKMILIAGGVGKNADFSLLIAPIAKYVKSVILIGEAAPLLANILAEYVNIQFASSMHEAVQLADKTAESGDSVLLSPACASFDMFKNFEHRGQVFSEMTLALRE